MGDDPVRVQMLLDSLQLELQRVERDDPPGFLRDAAVEALRVQIDRAKALLDAEHEAWGGTQR